MSDQGKYSHPNSNDPARNGQGHGEHESPDTERLKDQGREAAHDVYDAAQHQAEHYYDHQRRAFADHATTFTGVMKKTADEFDTQDQPFFSQQARKVADLADSFSHQLRDKDLRGICHDAQDYSRREPAIFIGGAIAAGFLVSRFLRSSRTHQQSSQQGRYSERTTDMNDSGSRYSSQHSSQQPSSQKPSSRHPSSFDNNGNRPAYGGALNDREPAEPSAYGYGEPSRPMSDDPTPGGSDSGRSSR